QFDVVRRDFSREFYYDDQSLMRFLNEFKVLMVYSGIDLLQRLALGGDLFFCLEALKTIARPTTRAVVPTPVAAQDIGYGSTQSSWHPGLQAHDGPGVKLHAVGFILWGGIVACAQLYAETKPSSQDCAFVVRPWFRTKPGCALIEISGIGLCAAQDTANAVSDRLAKFDDDAVAYLILSHQAALHVPRALQSLRYLVGLKMKNVTLVQWDDAAALTQTHHPQVRFVFLVQFNATALPPGLLSNDFPALLLDIEVCVSTLSTVPSSLPSLWPPGMWLFLDHSNFTTVPDVLLEMDLAFLNLAFNRIHDVPAKTFTNPSLTLIGVSGNPISVLPEVSPALLAPLGLLALDATNLTVLPSWMDETFLTSAEVYLGDTPYCNALGDDEAARTISDQPRCHATTLAEARRESARASELYIELSQNKFRACWVLTLLIHSVCATFYAMVAVAYHYLPSTALFWSVVLYSLSIDVDKYTLIVVVHVLLSAVHAFSILTMTWRSHQHCTLTFQSPKTTTTTLHSVLPGPTETSVYSVRWYGACQERVIGYMSRCRDFLDRMTSEHAYVALRKNLHVTFHIALQSYQCYRMSWFLSRMRLQRIYTAMLVINCWTNPLIQFGINSTNCSRKIVHMRIVVDLLLDVMFVIVIPCALLHTYYGLFDPVRRDFAREFYYDDQSLIGFLNEFKLLLVSTTIDLLQRILLGSNLLFCLESLKGIVRSRPPTNAIRPMVDSHRIQVNSRAMSASHQWSRSSNATTACSFLNVAMKLNKICQMGLVSWGLIVACAHMYAETQPTSQDCGFAVRPWFRAKPGCALVEISGTNFSADHDSQAAVEQRLAMFDDDAVLCLILSHYAALYVPRNLRTLRNLVGLKIKNSTLVEWGEEAALTQTDHPRVRFLFLVQFTASGIPQGLLSGDFPRLLLDIEVCVSTISELPSSLPSVWPAGAWLFIDYSNLTEIPNVLLEMDVAFLQLANNHIRTVPSELFTNPALHWIGLPGNPITFVPDSFVEARTPLQLLSLDHTNVSTLPAWMDEAFVLSTEVYLGNTPYCDTLGDSNQTARTVNGQLRCRSQDDCRRLHQVSFSH
ncbi:TPA: hypothetical protein N0F65_000997, partial [Lagenidium giganteum]